MRISESQLRKIIRSEIRRLGEVSTGATSMSKAKRRKGTSSRATTDAKSTYDKASTATDKAQTSFAALKGKNYRKAGRVRGTWDYSATGGRGWTANPDYSTAETQYNNQKAKSDSALTKYRSAQSQDDADSTPPTQGSSDYSPPPSGGGGAGGAPGAGGGKGKGKRGKAKDDE